MSEQESLQPLPAGARKELEVATAAYQEALAGDIPVLAKLAERGLDEAVVDGARLGVVADPFPGHYKFRDWLAIPYLDKDRGPLQLRFRCLADHDHRAVHGGKYMTIAGDPARTYNVGAIHAAASTGAAIHICEGELDSLILAKLGMNAIAIPGAAGWKARHRRMLAGFNTVYIWPDPDEAGDKLCAAILKSINHARRVRLRTGDVTETYVQGGSEALLAALEEVNGQ